MIICDPLYWDVGRTFLLKAESTKSLEAGQWHLGSSESILRQRRVRFGISLLSNASAQKTLDEPVKFLSLEEWPQRTSFDPCPKGLSGSGSVGMEQGWTLWGLITVIWSKCVRNVLLILFSIFSFFLFLDHIWQYLGGFFLAMMKNIVSDSAQETLWHVRDLTWISET